MMKKRKNVQFIAAAALTAALVTSQFSFATVMGVDFKEDMRQYRSAV